MVFAAVGNLDKHLNAKAATSWPSATCSGATVDGWRVALHAQPSPLQSPSTGTLEVATSNTDRHPRNTCKTSRRIHRYL